MIAFPAQSPRYEAETATVCFRGWRTTKLIVQSATIVLLFHSFTTTFISGLSAQVQGKLIANGVELHYKTFGVGEPLLLINGGPGASSNHLIPPAKALARNYKVIIFDQRGTGLSRLKTISESTISLQLMVDDVEALRKHLAIEAWVIEGHSFGGQLAMAYAARYPNRVRALILVGSAGVTLEYIDSYNEELFKRLTKTELADYRYWADPTRQAADPKRAGNEMLRAMLPALVYNRIHLPKLVSLYKNAFSPTVNAMVNRNLRSINFDLRQQMGGFGNPVLIVYGRHDALYGKASDQIRLTFKKARFEVIEDCGHIPFIEQPERFFRITKDFIKGLRL